MKRLLIKGTRCSVCGTAATVSCSMTSGGGWRSRPLVVTSLVLVHLVVVAGSGGETNFTMGVFVPLTGAKVLSREGVAVIEWSVARVNHNPSYTELRNNSVSIRYLMEDTKCDSDVGVYRFSQMVLTQTQAASRIHVIIGPSCDDVCRLLAGQARIYGVPIISFGCESASLSDRQKYPTFLRTTGSLGEVQQFLEQLLGHFGWHRLTLVHGQDTVWLETSDNFEAAFQTHDVEARQFSLNQGKDLHLSLQEEASQTRVFVLCAYGSDVMTFMAAAQDLGLTNGEYVFIGIEFVNMVKRVTDWTGDPAIFNGFLDITVDVNPESDVYTSFIHDIFNTTGSQDSSGCASIYEMGIHGALLSDAISLYAMAVNACLADGSDPTNATNLAKHMYGASIDGVSGRVQIQEDGARVATYMLHNIQNGCYVPVARFNRSRGMTLISTHAIEWPGGLSAPPAGAPLCGWSNELCLGEGNQRLIVTSSVTFATACVIMLCCAVCYLYLRRRAQLQKISSTDWKIPFEDLKTTWAEGEAQRSTGRLGSEVDMGQSQASLDSRLSQAAVAKQDPDVFCYKGELVMAKRINKKYIAMSFQLTREVNQIRQLNHRNINPLIGACVDLNQVRVISMCAHKGSLYDVIHSSSIKLDSTFLVSFALDICKGMAYVHTNPVCYHGNLKSSNVFVDRSWTCRVGDLQMFYLREGEVVTADPMEQARRQFWMAPEVLREEKLDDMGWQKADVYSYGIILYELITRRLPYDSYWSEHPEVVIAEVMKQRLFKQPAFRPLQEDATAMTDFMLLHSDNSAPYRTMKDLMQQCWEERPLLRPAMDHVLRHLKPHGRNDIIDNLTHMFTKSEDQLEKLVQQRTQELQKERDRTRSLLREMLPRSVADKLIENNENPAPESYECVTIFFSDIVGFTQLASEVEPLQVVELLNTLYTKFDGIVDMYKVYKVETIGDAYMIVSGLPERHGRHAGDMACVALHVLSGMRHITATGGSHTQLRIRIGIHSGPVVAGIVGVKMPRYCLFGDTVNTASRMESNGKPLRIHVSCFTKALLDAEGGFHLEERGHIYVKGKGDMVTYWLLGKDGFDLPLPDVSDLQD